MNLIRRLPNALTVGRMLMVPCVVGTVFLSPAAYHVTASTLFLAAGVTDFFDGYLARKFEAQSRLGRLLDPAADKLLVASALLALAHTGDLKGADIIPAAAILCREFLVSGLREFLAGDKVDLPVNQYGKVKTAVQMTAIYLLLLGPEGFGEGFGYAGDLLSVTSGRALLWAAGGMTVFSGYVYLRAGLKYV